MAVQKSQRSLCKKKIRKLKVTNIINNKKIIKNLKFKIKTKIIIV
jgi:hypothetical protein